MSFENPSQIIRSWGLTKNFAAGPTTVDKLVPPTYGKVRTPFVQTWREETVSTNLDWGSQNFSYYLPESLRVISSMFLRIECPLINGHNFKPYAGMYAVKTVRLLSAGQEVYTCDVQAFLRDYCESLSNEELEAFGRIYLGHTANASATKRSFIIPILLPNSAYMQRHGHNTRGSGIWPCFTAQNRLEVQITLNPSTFVSLGSNVPASISGACSIMMHQVDMSSADVLRYSDLRGTYSLINRRFTELTSGWTPATTDVQKWTNSQPVGCVTEVFIIAVATGTDEPLRDTAQVVLPTSFKVVADSVTQKDLNNADKVQMELYSNGFTANSEFNNCARLCFASHAAESTHHYSGGYNMQLASNVSFEFKFAEAVDYRLYAVQLQRCSIDSLGLIRASLE